MTANEGSAPVEQFYETKLFRVLVARHPLVDGHVIIQLKRPDPHFYSLTLDELEEFGYLIKKVSFIVMRFARAQGFSVVMSDGAEEVLANERLEVHVVPRKEGDSVMGEVASALAAAKDAADDAAVESVVQELKNLMQLPQ